MIIHSTNIQTPTKKIRSLKAETVEENFICRLCMNLNFCSTENLTLKIKERKNGKMGEIWKGNCHHCQVEYQLFVHKSSGVWWYKEIMNSGVWCLEETMHDKWAFSNYLEDRMNSVIK